MILHRPKRQLNRARAMRLPFLLSFVLLASVAHAADACQDLVRLTDLPQDFKTISVSALGPAELSMKSNGHCTCNDLPAVQRHLGQQQPEGVNWACYPAEADDSKAK